MALKGQSLTRKQRGRGRQLSTEGAVERGLEANGMVLEAANSPSWPAWVGF